MWTQISFWMPLFFSDIARGSYSLESTIIYGGAIIPLDDVSLKKHVGKFLVKDFV